MAAPSARRRRRQGHMSEGTGRGGTAGSVDPTMPVQLLATRREGSGWRAGAGTPGSPRGGIRRLPGSRCPGSSATTSA